jgi:hypothetical protein
MAEGPVSGFRGRRAKTDYTHEVDAPPEAVFPLLCPVREYEWVEGWSCEMVFSESGVAEENCIFRTGGAPHGLSTRCVTRYEPPVRIQFVVVAADMVLRLTITLERTSRGTKLHWERLFTGLTGEGNAHAGDQRVERDRGLGEQLNCFLRTGKMLRAATSGG